MRDLKTSGSQCLTPKFVVHRLSAYLEKTFPYYRLFDGSEIAF